MKWLSVSLLVTSVGCAGERAALEGVPRAATSALRDHSHDRITRAEREVEDGMETWEGSWSEGGRKHELKVTADGRVLEHEVEVMEGEVPAAVRATAERVLGGKPHYVKVLTTGNYEAERIVDGKERDVMIAPDGSVVGGEDAPHDDQDGD